MGKVTASHKPAPRPLPLPFSLTVGVSSDHPDPSEPRLEILNTVVLPSVSRPLFEAQIAHQNKGDHGRGVADGRRTGRQRITGPGRVRKVGSRSGD